MTVEEIAANEAPAISTAIAEYSPVVRDLAELKRRLGGVAYDLTTAAGLDQARADRWLCVKMRTALEEKRREIKAPALERSRAIDADAKLIEAAIREIEAPIDEQVKAVEAAKEAERQRKLQAEAEKIAAVRRRIVDTFTCLPAPGVRPSAAELMAMHDRIATEPVNDSYGDLQIEAEETKKATLSALHDRIADQQGVEAQQAEVERQRQFFLEEQRQETARRAAERVEQDRRDAELAAERERLRQVEAEVMAAHRAENARREAQIAAREAEVARREAEAREADEARQRAEQAKRDRLAAEREAERQAEIAAAERRLRAAHETEARLTSLAPAMRDCLQQWASGEALGDTGEFNNARAERDRILAEINNRPSSPL
jgi:colicin import membrane protein